MYQNLSDKLTEYLLGLDVSERDEAIFNFRQILTEASSHKEQPVDLVQWIPIENVSPNDYNPNSVARTELQLLYVSIKHDGYTQPIVTVRDGDKYVIVDGFHRYYVMKANSDIYVLNHGKLPVTIINKSINDRMASTIRHNRARGKHTVAGMSSLIFSMLDNGWDDVAICNELGMEPEELLRLKHITGFSKLFENVEYKKAWVSKREIQARMQNDGN